MNPASATAELQDLKQYIGRSRTSTDVVTASAVGRLAAAIDADLPALADGDPIPHGWHGAFFPPLHRVADLRPDGQFGGGGLAPVLLPRRRLTGSRSAYHDALRVGDRVTQTVEVADVVIRDRGAGPTVLVVQRESIRSPRGLAVVEERDVLFFGADGPGALDAPAAVPATAAWRRTWEPNPVMIWRLCAVRYNSHRIHFDRDYTTRVEGYPGIVVPVTLVSQLMLEMCRTEEPKRPLAAFAYTSIAPICDTGPFTILGSPAPAGPGVVMWALDPDGKLALTAEATFAGKAS
jgi:3-methylfumaryl-CoA hydratase